MSFFSAQPMNYVLTPRDWMHQAAFLFLVLSIVLVIIFRKKLRTWKYEKHFRYIITIIAIAAETTFRVWKHLTQEGTILTDNLPLHLCSITLALCWVAMLFYKKWAFKLAYFYSIGAMISMFVADCGGFGIDHFRYYQYFYIHGYIVFTPIYFIAVHKYNIVFKDLIKAALVLVAIFCVVMPIDYFLGANYMYLMHKPPVASPLDLLGPWPGYIAAMTVIAICAFIIFYFPWLFVNISKKRGNMAEID